MHDTYVETCREHMAAFADHATYREFAGTLEQSIVDRRQHRLISLPNGLTALCTHDANAPYAAAAMTVNVGSLIDPPSHLGLAHLLEHMLTMGSAKYPQEDGYLNYISSNAGVQNAFTYDNTTTYFFHVSPDALEGALDRFSQAFTHPLLSESCAKREVNAVDSEFKGLLQFDDMKLRQIKKSSACPDHPYSYFYVGNLETLQTDGLVKQVQDLFTKYYSADVMKLCVVSSHGISQIVEWVVSMFSGIQRREPASQQLPGHPLSKDMLGKLVYYQTNEQCYKMDVEFPLPDIQPLYRTAPGTYYSSLLEYKGPGSLYEMLVLAELIVDIKSYVAYPYYDGFNMFTVQFTLSQSGYQQPQAVLNALFAYFQMLEEKGPQGAYFNELAMKQKLDCASESQNLPDAFCTSTSIAMCNRYLRPQDTVTHCASHYDARLISEFIRYFTPDTCQVFIGGPDHPELSLDSYEPYFKIPYCTQKLEHLQDAVKLSSDPQIYRFSLPAQNPYMPRQLDVVGTLDSDERSPTLLQKTDLMETWHKLDNQFMTPYGNVYLLILLANAEYSVKDQVVADVLETYINKELEPVSSDANAAGMEFTLTSKPGSLLITVSGISENQPLLLETILQKVRALKVSKHAYNRAVADTKLMYQDMRLKQPAEQLQDLETTQFAQSPAFNSIELENTPITMADIQDKASSMFSQTYSKLLVNGNFSEQHTIDIATMVRQTIGSKPLSTICHIPVSQVSIKPGHYIYQTTAADLDTTNNAVRVNIYCGSDANHKDAVIIELLVSLISKSFFSQLRTREQLGYTVQAYYETHDNGSIAMVFCIQGEANPLYLTMRINQFIKEFRQCIAAYSVEEFRQLVEASKTLRSRVPNDINFESRRFWVQIEAGTYDFDVREHKLELLDCLQHRELLEMWDNSINSETASNYTRVDMLMWATKACFPTEVELANYSEEMLCLHKCLESAGYNVNIGELQTFVESQSSDHGEQLEAWLLEHANSNAAFNRKAMSANMVKKSLDAAVRSIGPHSKPATAQQTSHESKSMLEISGSRWLVTDIALFKQEQNTYPLPTSATKLHPKYTAEWKRL